MKRLVESQILSWIGSKRRKPLIIRGARQVGKTWLVEEFAARQFPAFVKVDFEERGDLHFLFEGNLEPRFVLESLETTRHLGPYPHPAAGSWRT